MPLETSWSLTLHQKPGEGIKETGVEKKGAYQGETSGRSCAQTNETQKPRETPAPLPFTRLDAR